MTWENVQATKSKDTYILVIYNLHVCFPIRMNWSKADFLSLNCLLLIFVTLTSFLVQTFLLREKKKKMDSGMLVKQKTDSSVMPLIQQAGNPRPTLDHWRDKIPAELGSKPSSLKAQGYSSHPTVPRTLLPSSSTSGAINLFLTPLKFTYSWTLLLPSSIFSFCFHIGSFPTHLSSLLLFIILF